ncbi:MAG: carboxylating nicotinate-nucleotide diphosphorylase [Bifidobacterium crudilactis]|jgi:nicotinate-nucleotide pyrophosphorylase (carboxylating)|nr:carboxylating nicotinate-nucleotide diphosphorylase [Bifidobacterium crudilactis]MCI1888884.1 carboxylating nicotinate-nucleotide diphosphorylase [Bifidobacterium crudilactis]
MLTRAHTRAVIEAALEEDAPYGDTTCAYAMDGRNRGSARLVAREAGVMSGAQVFAEVFGIQDSRSHVVSLTQDGESFAPGQVLAEVDGYVGDVLSAERVALNFVQRMCGIATMTADFVAASGDSHARISDTRKTTPGLRAFEKYAVTCGGGVNHRQGLSDAVMLKDNHLAALAAQGLSAGQAVRRIRLQVGHTTHIEVEIDRLDQLNDVLSGHPDSIMFDNFSTEDMAEGVRRVDGRAIVEASGNMTVERIPEVARTGVDIISVGALTHSVRSIDLGLDWSRDVRR